MQPQQQVLSEPVNSKMFLGESRNEVMSLLQLLKVRSRSENFEQYDQKYRFVATFWIQALSMQVP